MKKIQLANNRGVALVDDSDFEILSRIKCYAQQGAYTVYAICNIYRDGKWMAKINKDGKRHNLGYCNSEIEAAKLYDTAAKKLFGEFANTNF